MTAVEFLIQQIDNKDMGEIPMWIYDLCYDALEMEKQQILKAYDKGYDSYPYEPQNYYNETYKTNNP